MPLPSDPRAACQPGLTNCLSFVADYTSSVATKYLKRGFRAATSSKSLVVLLLSMAVSVALELANMAQKGELQRLWAVAKQTDLTFNLVSSRGECSHLGGEGELRCLDQQPPRIFFLAQPR